MHGGLSQFLDQPLIFYFPFNTVPFFFLQEHKASLDPQNSRDFMDDVLIMNSTTPVWNELQILDTVIMFTPDAIETTS